MRILLDSLPHRRIFNHGLDSLIPMLLGMLNQVAGFALLDPVRINRRLQYMPGMPQAPYSRNLVFVFPLLNELFASGAIPMFQLL